jgi:hypothetical protein
MKILTRQRAKIAQRSRGYKVIHGNKKYRELNINLRHELEFIILASKNY